MDDMYYGHAIFFPFYGIFMWIFWLLLIGLLFGGFGWRRRGEHGWWKNMQDKTPMDILKERYAKGEITKQQFEEMKKDVV